MATDDTRLVHSPTVVEIIERFVALVRADPAIDDGMIDRLAPLLYSSPAPKADEIKTALFPPLTEIER